MSPVLLIAAAGGLGLILLAASRPTVACALLAAAIPLTAGLGRGTVVPLLRVNEALLLIVAGGVLLGFLPRRRTLAFNGLDLVVLAFCAGGILIPWAVVLLTHASVDLQDWMTILAPVQYLVVYLIYSRVEFSAADLRLLLNLLMLVSVPVALIAVAQLLDLGGIRTLIGTYYPVQPMPSWDTVYRPASLLGFYSAVGAFGLLNFLLALALAATRHPGFSQLWLTVVMGVNVVGMLATQTYAPLIALPIGAAAVLLTAGRIPWRQLALAPPSLIASAILLWPILGNRVQQQLAWGGGGVLKLPESIAVRVEYWQGFFLPALLKHGLWLGTGTLIPSEVPRPLTTFVDNGYLWQAFRAGLPGLALYLILLAAILGTAWKTRFAEASSRRAVAAVCVGVVVSVLLLDTTSEYLTMTAVTQEFWMLVGLMTGLAFAAHPSPASVVELASPALAWRGGAVGWRGRPVGWREPAGRRRVPPTRRRVPAVRPAPPSQQKPPARRVPAVRPVPPVDWALPPARRRLPRVGWRLPRVGSVAGPFALARRLVPGRALVKSSMVVLVGGGLAALLGFAFQVAAGRLLEPTDYGRLTYALTVANIASVLLSTVPVGLSRFLARHTERRSEQESYYGNWLAVIAVVLGTSVLGTAIVAPAIGLGGWWLAGLIANLFGITALVAYREVQRGLGRFTLQSVFYALANGLQLAAILAVGAAGWRSPQIFLSIYGLSGVTALVCVLPLSRQGPRFRAAALAWSRMKEVSRFLRPVLIQAIFWNLWSSGDLVLVQHFGGPTATGIYGSAKAIASGFQLIPGAVSFVFAPQVARLHASEIRGHLARAMAFTVAMMLPVAAAAALVGTPVIVAIFGPRYQSAGPSLAVLSVGMVFFGLKYVTGSLWLGIGYPVVGTVSSAAGMIATFVIGILLIPSRGAVGAAVAFSAGALAQLLVEGAVTLWAFGGRTPRVTPLGDRPATTDGPATEVRPESSDQPAGVSEPPPVLFFAEEVAPTPDDGYTTFVAELGSALAARRPLERRFTPAGPGLRLLPLRILDHARQLVRATRSGAAGRGAGPVIYAPRQPVTLPVLLRARALRLPTRRSPVAVIALKGCSIKSPRLLRRLAPDLLLLPSADECDLARRSGVNAAVVWGDMDRLAKVLGERRLPGLGYPWDLGPPAPETDAWPAISDRLLCMLDDVALLRASHRPRRNRLSALTAKARRFYVARRGWWRQWRWGDRVAYESREPRTVVVTPPVAATLPPAIITPSSDVVALMASGSDLALGAAAQLAGLGLETAAHRGPEDLIDHAIKERWPILHLRSEHLDALPLSLWSPVAAYLRAGGTLYVDGLEPARQERLAAVCGFLRVPAPAVTGTPLMGSLSFPAGRADFARELAGTKLEALGGRTSLSRGDGWEVLAFGETPDRSLPVLVRRQLGQGALVLSVAPSQLTSRLADAYTPGSAAAMAAVLPAMLLRAVYGSAAWHPPATLANLSIDDPALRQGLLGVRWDLLLTRAREVGFHATIATVPRELGLADEAVVEVLRRHRELLSACYHGCNHDSYEFYSPEARRTRYPARPLSDQRRRLEHAVELGRRFSRKHGLDLDRVMVFPHGVGPAEIFPDMQRLGFLGTCNYGDKYPPGSTPPDDPDLGLRPADLAWAGFPLLWRRDVDDQGYLLDLLLGRPLLTFAHTGSLGADFSPLDQRAERINRASGGAAIWCGLDEIARHAYLQRRRPDGSWEVLMTTNEACLHNPDAKVRNVVIRRPHLPSGGFFEVDGKRTLDPATVSISGRDIAVVRLAGDGAAPALPGRNRCSIFRSGQGEIV